MLPCKVRAVDWTGRGGDDDGRIDPSFMHAISGMVFKYFIMNGFIMTSLIDAGSFKDIQSISCKPSNEPGTNYECNIMSGNTRLNVKAMVINILPSATQGAVHEGKSWPIGVYLDKRSGQHVTTIRTSPGTTCQLNNISVAPYTAGDWRGVMICKK